MTQLFVLTRSRLELLPVIIRPLLVILFGPSLHSSANQKLSELIGLPPTTKRMLNLKYLHFYSQKGCLSKTMVTH